MPSDHQSRIPADEIYLGALGRAAYNFAYLEWGIVWLCEMLEPGFVQRAASMMAGKIAAKFTSVVGALSPSDPELASLAATFADLVKCRNQLLHGNPFTADEGEQRLLYNARGVFQDWTRDRILKIAGDFEVAAIEAVALYNKRRNLSSN